MSNHRIMIIMIALLSSLSSWVHAGVILDGKEWMQVIDTVNFTYNDAADTGSGPCSVITGLCNGTATRQGVTIDLTGWTWASNDDMASLFALITGAPVSAFTGPGQPNYSEPAATANWAANFIDTDGGGPDQGLFHATAIFSSTDHAVFGLTRTVVNGNADRSYIRSTAVNAVAITGNPVGLDISRSHTGLWFYRPVNVPEPASLSLLVMGLLLLAGPWPFLTGRTRPDLL